MTPSNNDNNVHPFALTALHALNWLSCTERSVDDNETLNDLWSCKVELIKIIKDGNTLYVDPARCVVIEWASAQPPRR